MFLMAAAVESCSSDGDGIVVNGRSENQNNLNRVA